MIDFKKMVQDQKEAIINARRELHRIPGWEEDSTYGDLPDYPACISSKLQPADRSYTL